MYLYLYMPVWAVKMANERSCLLNWSHSVIILYQFNSQNHNQFMLSM